MTPKPRRGLSPGCLIGLALGGLAACCVLFPVGHFVWSVVQMNLHRDDFAAFDRIAPGTPVSEVVARAEALGFEREPIRGDPAPAGRPEHLGFEKVVVPPYGRWFIHVEHVDGGVVSVRTTTLD